MHPAYVGLTATAAVVYGYAAVLNFTHNRLVAETAARLGVPPSWMVPLGALLAAGSIGMVAGFVVPPLGIAAAGALVLYFAGAAGAHIRARDTQLLAWVNWAAFFLLAVAALALGLASRHWW